MKKEIQKVPKLRFKEFEGDWVNKKLKDVTKIERGRFSPRPRNNPIYYNGDIPFVQTSDVVNSRGRIKYYNQTLNEKGLKVSKLFKKGNLLITIAANIGYAGVLEIDMACPDSLVGIIPNQELHNYFLNYLFLIEQPRMDYLAINNAQKNINVEFLKFYSVFITSLPEQEKIASFLTSVDKRIEQLRQKKALLEQYKKGMMQKLFKQELRFKKDDGGAFEDWEVKKLNTIAKPIKRRAKKVIDNIMTISAGKGFLDQKDRFNRVIAGSSLKKYTHLKRNEFSYNRGNSKSYTYGCIYRLKNVEEALVPYVYRSFELKKGIPEFFEQLFSSKYLDKQLRTLISSSARMDGLLNIGESDFYNVKIMFPPLEEQQKIASFLTAIDERIAEVGQQLEGMETWKRGLLQQMFV